MFSTVDEIKAANIARGHHFFDPDVMRFFKSSVLPKVYAGHYFITCERYAGVPNYKVRYAQDDGSVETIGHYGTLAYAKDVIKWSIAGVLAERRLGA